MSRYRTHVRPLRLTADQTDLLLTHYKFLNDTYAQLRAKERAISTLGKKPRGQKALEEWQRKQGPLQKERALLQRDLANATAKIINVLGEPLRHIQNDADAPWPSPK